MNKNIKINKINKIYKNNKKKIIILFSIIILLTIFLTMHFIQNNNANNKNIDSKNNNIDIKSYFTNRYILEKNENIFIGKNKKECENGYFDINITKTKVGYLIYVNKLFKEDLNKLFYDNIYCNELTTYLSKIVNIEHDSLFNLIKNKYIDLKVNKKNIDEIKYFNKYVLDIKNINNMLVIDIGGI